MFSSAVLDFGMKEMLAKSVDSSKYHYEIRRLYGTPSAGLVPPLLHLIRLSEKKIMLIRSSTKLLQSSTHQNPAKPLSDAFFGMARRRDDVSSVRFLNRPANKKK
jgi:hypothetical protein